MPTSQKKRLDTKTRQHRCRKPEYRISMPQKKSRYPKKSKKSRCQTKTSRYQLKESPTKSRQKPEEPKRKTRHRPRQIPRGIHTAGWRGPWAALLFLGESPQGTMVPRGPKTPPTAPSGAIPEHRSKQINKYPKRMGPTLSRSFGSNMTSCSDCVTNKPRQRPSTMADKKA